MTATNQDRVAPLYETLAGGRHRLNMHRGQWAAWNSEARFVVVVKAFQSGGTEWGAHWLAREIQQLRPCDAYAVTSSYLLFERKMLPAMIGEAVGDTPAAPFARSRGWSYRASTNMLQAKDGSHVFLGSASAPGGLESGTAKVGWLDECGMQDFPREAHEAIRRRVAIHQGRILYTSMPYNWGWWKVDVIDRALGGDRDYELVRFESLDNPAFSRAEYELFQRELPPWKFDMYCHARFTRPAGLIYSDYVESYAPQDDGPDGWTPVKLADWQEGVSGHLVRPFSIPKTWPRLVGVDFGGTEHTALLWLAEDRESGNYYAYRETLGGGLSGAEHARGALEYGEPVKFFMGGTKGESDARNSWRRAGVAVQEPRLADVEAGIDRVVGLFRDRRLFVFETLTRLRSELGAYSRELDGAGDPTLKIDHKERFHLLDGLRYIASAIPLRRPRVKGPGPLEVAPLRSLAFIRADYARWHRTRLAAAGKLRKDYPGVDLDY